MAYGLPSIASPREGRILTPLSRNFWIGILFESHLSDAVNVDNIIETPRIRHPFHDAWDGCGRANSVNVL